MKVEIEDVRAWVDGELDERQANAVANAVKGDTQLKKAADAVRTSQLPYREAFEQAPVPEIPDTLREKITALRNTPTEEVTSNYNVEPINNPISDPIGNPIDNNLDDNVEPINIEKQRSFGMLGLAASVMVAAILGFLLGSNRNIETSEPIAAVDQNTPADQSTASTPVDPSTHSTVVIRNGFRHPDNFARAVAAYQSLYVRETVNGADNSPAAVKVITERLTSQTDMPIIIPELEGYEFVRGQRLAFGDDPLIQLVYIGAEGVPLALCFIPAHDVVADAEQNQEHVADLGNYYGLNTAEWKHNGQIFVMVSDASKEKLGELSQSAFKQWQI